MLLVLCPGANGFNTTFVNGFLKPMYKEFYESYGPGRDTLSYQIRIGAELEYLGIPFNSYYAHDKLIIVFYTKEDMNLYKLVSNIDFQHSIITLHYRVRYTWIAIIKKLYSILLQTIKFKKNVVIL